MSPLLLLSFLTLLQQHHVLAQFPPPPPSADDDPSIKTIHSPVDGNITIRYKSPPPGTCETVFPTTQKQYTGYIHLPPFTLAPIQQNYSINTFFWFVESRTSPETAPLTIFMNGGPGSSSMVGMFQEVGPCEVVEIGKGKLGTRAREWGWDRSSNMSFVDQPNQVGFSYDRLVNGSLDLLEGRYLFPPADDGSHPEHTFLNGTFSSNDESSTANTTAIAARAVWHILQGFLGAFPQYNPRTRSSSNESQSDDDDDDDDFIGINLFTESYGGKYGPAFATYWEEQNKRLRNGELPRETTLTIELKSLGILQGCIDDLINGLFYPRFAYSNTYGIKAVSLADQQNMASAFLVQDGCQQRIQSCRTAVQAMDPEGEGNSDTTNAICADAQNYCTRNVIIGPYINSGLSAYDISQSSLNPFPPNAYLEYLDTAAVQSAIGVPLNFAPSSPAVFAAGHLIPAYQPETLFTLFTRIILGTDLSSGELVDLASFRT